MSHATSRRTGVIALVATLAMTGLGALSAGTAAEAARSTPAARGSGSGVTMAVETGADRKTPRPKTRERGRVKQAADGDTLWVRLNGGKRLKGVREHKKRRGWYAVRLAGVQATETKHTNGVGSRNWCHGVPARTALRRLTKGKKVQLRSLRKGSRASGKRLQRHVFVKRKGRWTDVATILLERGLLMSHPMKPEWSQNVRYSSLMQQAMARGVNMWDTDKCGSGPQQEVPLRMWVAWDAPGFDNHNLNGEYVVIQNLSETTTLSLAGWRLRDTSLEMYTFPSSARIAPGSFVRVHTGSGTSTADRFYWGISHNMWQNPDSEGYADTAVLLDPQGDFRAHFTYPCLVSCADPLAGKVRIAHVQWDADGDDNQNVNGEYVVIRNVTNDDVPLGGYYLQRGEFVKLAFRPLQVLPAGGTLTVHMGKGTDTPERMYFGESTSSLNNSGSSVSIAQWNGVRVDCSSWGKGRC